MAPAAPPDRLYPTPLIATAITTVTERLGNTRDRADVGNTSDTLLVRKNAHSDSNSPASRGDHQHGTGHRRSVEGHPRTGRLTRCHRLYARHSRRHARSAALPRHPAPKPNRVLHP